MKKFIGVIGLGMVGSQVKKYFEKIRFRVVGYDKFKNINSLREVNKAKIIFLCLPTPYRRKSGYTINALEEVIRFFKTPKIFVIKSTVLPGTTEYFQRKYRRHQFLHNPEFLRDASAWEDFINPDVQLVGYTSKSKKLASRLLGILPKAGYRQTFSSRTTELAKLINNAFLSLKVVFANEVYDIAEKIGVKYDYLIEAVGNDRRIGKSHLYVWHDGYRGFGGKCLPKDLSALLSFSRHLKLKSRLLQSANEINLKFLRKQRLLGRLQEWLDNKS